MVVFVEMFILKNDHLLQPFSHLLGLPFFYDLQPFSTPTFTVIKHDLVFQISRQTKLISFNYLVGGVTVDILCLIGLLLTHGIRVMLNNECLLGANKLVSNCPVHLKVGHHELI